MNADNYEVDVWFENRQWRAVLYTRDEFGNRADGLAAGEHEDAVTLMALMGRYIVEHEQRAVTA